MRENEESIRAVDLIQKALLKSIKEKEFVQISISSLCEKAGVSRTTFYKHYHNTSEVLDAVLERILAGVDTLDHEVLGLHAAHSAVRRIPLCELARRDPQVLALFQDETTAKRMVDRIVDHNLQGIIGHRALTLMEEQQLHSVFNSLAYGCQALITTYGQKDEETWQKMRSTRDSFVAAGLNQLLESADLKRLYIRTSSRDHVLSIPAHSFMKELRIHEDEEHEDGSEKVQQALRNVKFSSVVHPGEKVAVLTDDRAPFPVRQVLPAVLRHLSNAGVKEEDITIVFATGLHAPLSRKRMEELVGKSITRQYHCVNSDPEDTVDLGWTVRGTPVQITRVVAQADRRICLGHVGYSSLCGYTGGLNGLIPGCASRATILMNHKEMCSYRASPGVRKGNPIYEDLQEAASHLHVDLLVNAVLNRQAQIVSIFAGEPRVVHEAAVNALDSRYRRIVPREASVVVVSGKDETLQDLVPSARNMYSIVQRGGTIVLVGSCRSGIGTQAFTDRLFSSDNPQTVLRALCMEFDPQATEAAVLARLCLKAEVVLVSDLPEGKLKGTMIKTAASVQEAVDQACSRNRDKAEVLVVQEGDRILPELKEQ